MRELHGLTPKQMKEVWSEVEVSIFMEDLEHIAKEKEFKNIKLTEQELRTIAVAMVNNLIYEFDYLGYAKKAMRMYLEDREEVQYV